MATTVNNNPFDATQKQFAGTGDVVGNITGGARNGTNWNFMDQQGNVLTSVPYDDYVKNYMAEGGAGVVRGGINDVNGVPVYNFNSGASAAQAPVSAMAAAPTTSTANGGGIISGSMSGTAPSTSAITQTPAGVAQFTPETRAVDRQTQTAAGQVESLLSKDSPLLQRARTLAAQGMAQRGLVNSSMAQGAGVSAMVDRITPIAQQDANTYNAVASENMAANNTAGQFNVGEQNKNTLQTAQQNFVAAQSALDRAQQTALADKSIVAQQELQKAQQVFQSAQSELDRAQQTNLQASQQTFQSGQANLDRAQQATLTAQQIAAQERLTLAQIDATAKNLSTGNQAQMDQIKLQIENNKTETGKAYAANLAAQATAQVNALLADPNLDAAAKQAAIDNVIKNTNSSLQWASTFYNTSLPSYTAPGGTATTIAPGSGAGSSFSSTQATIKSYVQDVMGGTGTAAEKAAKINAAASSAGVTREQIAAATGVSLADVNTFLNTPAPAASAPSAAPAASTPAPTAAAAPAPTREENIKSYVTANKNDPAAISKAAIANGVSLNELAASVGVTPAEARAYFQSAGVAVP